MGSGHPGAPVRLGGQDTRPSLSIVCPALFAKGAWRAGLGGCSCGRLPSFARVVLLLHNRKTLLSRATDLKIGDSSLSLRGLPQGLRSPGRAPLDRDDRLRYTDGSCGTTPSFVKKRIYMHGSQQSNHIVAHDHDPACQDTTYAWAPTFR